jgi:hypothetical protein
VSNVVTKVHAHHVLMDIIYLDQVVNPVSLHVRPALEVLKAVRHVLVNSPGKELNVDEIVELDLNLHLKEVFHFFHF